MRRHLAALMATLVVGFAGAAPAAAGGGLVESDGDPAGPVPSSGASAVTRPAGGERVPFTGVDLALLLGGSLAVIGLGVGVRYVTESGRSGVADVDRNRD